MENQAMKEKDTNGHVAKALLLRFLIKSVGIYLVEDLVEDLIVKFY